jgi:hypothetical protein
LEQALVIHNLFYFQFREEKYMFERSEFVFLETVNKINFRIPWRSERIQAIYTFVIA